MGPYNFKYQNHIISKPTTVDKENVEHDYANKKLCHSPKYSWQNDSFQTLYIPLIKNFI